MSDKLSPLDALEAVLEMAGAKDLGAFIDLGELLDDIATGDLSMDRVGPELLPLLPRLVLGFQQLGDLLAPVMPFIRPDPEKVAARRAKRHARKDARKAKRAERRGE